MVDFVSSWILYLVVPVIILFVYIMFKSKKMPFWFFISRIFVVSLLLVALAGPFVMEETYVQGDPRVKVLIDNSTSFNIFNLGEVDGLVKQLEDRVDVDVKYIAYGERSALGDGILSELSLNDNVLLVSDGHNNYGASLDDVALFTKSLNATVSALNLEPANYDVAVRVLGPDKTAANVNNDFKVVVERSSGMKAVPLVVKVDGQVIYNTDTTSSEFVFSKEFTEGYHKVEAKVLTEDYFVENNEYYKVVKVVPKPKVLFVTKNPSSLQQLFDPIYDLHVVDNVPAALDNYAAVVINNMDSSISNLDVLNNFVAEGNGLIVVGGINAFDSGDYKNSQFEQLLPVYVAQAGKKRGDTSIVVVLDTSGSTSSSFLGDKAVDVEKALAVDILKETALIHNVGVVAFKTESYEVAPLKKLMEQEEDVLTKIASLRDFGGTKIYVGVMKALEMLSASGGSKNIILITDGKTQGYDESLASAKRCNDLGIKLYTVGIGRGSNRDLLIKMADLGNGAYFEPQNREGLRILFGRTIEGKDKSSWGTNVIDANHFITDSVSLEGVVYGFNTVVPKSAAKLLVTTDQGDPLVSSWRFGLGRVVAVSTDDGSLYASELLNSQNSRLWTRVVNYGIGDPERKSASFVDVFDARVGSEVEVIVKALDYPSGDISFVSLDENIYSGSMFFDTKGFTSVLGSDVAVNDPIEYERVGLSADLQNIVLMSGGRMFEVSEVEDMIDFIKAKSRRIELERKSWAWPFILVALLIFTCEVCVRRVMNNKGML